MSEEQKQAIRFTLAQVALSHGKNYELPYLNAVYQWVVGSESKVLKITPDLLKPKVV